MAGGEGRPSTDRKDPPGESAPATPDVVEGSRTDRRARLERAGRIAGLLAALLFCASPAFLMPWEHGRLVSQEARPGDKIHYSMVVGMVLLPLILGGIPCGIAGLFLRGRRAGAVMLLLAAVVAVASFKVGREAGWKVRMTAFEDLAERGEPLVAAIHAFERERGGPPERLDELVPDYLPAIPSTGMGAYPDFQYGPVTSGDPRYTGSSWALEVECGWGALNWDRFLYLPSGRYPEEGFGGFLERVGDWAYLHE